MTNKHPYAFTRLNIPESYSFIARAGGNVVTVYMPLDTLLCKIFPGRREKKKISQGMLASIQGIDKKQVDIQT
jgi:hypothetical protein